MYVHKLNLKIKYICTLYSRRFWSCLKDPNSKNRTVCIRVDPKTRMTYIMKYLYLESV